jgi:hypothetical protein
MDTLSYHGAFTGGIVTKWRRIKLKMVAYFTIIFYRVPETNKSKRVTQLRDVCVITGSTCRLKEHLVLGDTEEDQVTP